MLSFWKNSWITMVWFVKCLFVLIPFCFELCHGQATRLQYPGISSVTPSFGSVEGGTWITIAGVNFMASGMFTNRVILVGGQVCKEIPYFTTNQRIVCVSPRCVEPACLSDPLWQGSITVSINVYVQDVETILGASSTFSYAGGYTPQIFALTKNVRGGAVASVIGRPSTDILSDIQIKIGGNKAYLGDPGEINGNSISMWSNTQQIYYTPPTDQTAGYYNLSFESQDDQSQGSKGTGLARLFPVQRAYTDWGFPYYYNWDCSLLGNVFNVQLSPTITSISPAMGSMGGGTVVTIQGSGFSKTLLNNAVFIGGLPCDVISADYSVVTCTTRSLESSFNYQGLIDTSLTAPRFQRTVVANSSRNFGSPGWWVQLWSVTDYNSNTMTLKKMKLSFGFKQDMTFSLYQLVGSSWPSVLNYVDGSFSGLTFAADLSTFLVAPISGFYRFYVNSDDYNYLYGKLPGGSERLLLSTSYTAIDDLYSNGFPSHISSSVYLKRGQRYKLRSRLVNSGGSQDFLRVGMRIDPNFTDPANNQAIAGVMEDDFRFYNYSLTALQSNKFLHHHGLRTIQIVSLKIFYQQEIQTIVITGIQGGTFSLIVEDSVPTDAFTVSSSGSTIAAALRVAALQLSSPTCSYFSVSTTVTNKGSSGKNIIIKVQFNVDNSQPLPLLGVFVGDTVGSNVTFGVTRTQLHSPLPSGNLKMTLNVQNQLQQFSMPISADSNQFRSNVAKALPAVQVDVRRTGSFYTGYSWIVTFIRPRGLIPTMTLNTSLVTGPQVNGSVATLQNGSDSMFWFNSIPVWMTEVPLDVATQQTVRSNAEVYVKTDGGEYLKAVCDGSSDLTPSISFIKGNESTCAYSFSSAASAIISGSSLFTVDAETTGVQINGNYFDLAGTELSKLGVTIAGHSCNVSSFNTTHILCFVKSVPWGQYYPVVNLAGFGNVVISSTASPLSFKQSIYSISPQIGSFSGGQLVTIHGRGFRENATITFGTSSAPCEIIQYSSSVIICRTPAGPNLYTAVPTAIPTEIPTANPTEAPTYVPTAEPTHSPTSEPTYVPSQDPTPKPTYHPTSTPTEEPTTQPTELPTFNPTEVPSAVPSIDPTSLPTEEPSADPTIAPTYQPSAIPSHQPSSYPTVSQRPTVSPTENPSVNPTRTPTAEPSAVPSNEPSAEPSVEPTAVPTYEPTTVPSQDPTHAPTAEPSVVPTAVPTYEPTTVPSQDPTHAPTAEPSVVPTAVPTYEPTTVPSQDPTHAPTAEPSVVPTAVPTYEPTTVPSQDPTHAPTAEPSVVPTAVPTYEPTTVPSQDPTHAPTAEPSVVPTAVPTYEPTTVPSQDPTHAPTAEPSVVPTAVPTYEPTTVPSQDPTHAPTAEPSVVPTAVPTYEPTTVPSQDPTHAPTAEPSVVPTAVPTYEPTTVPSQDPTHAPTAEPSVVPTAVPTYEPTTVPSQDPTHAPTAEPSVVPTAVPTYEPTTVPSQDPTHAPTAEPSVVPTAVPTYEPTTVPSQDPTHAPTAEPSVVPTAVPTYEPTTVPSQDPTHAPTAEPSVVPTAVPTYEPTTVPSQDPTHAPTAEPSVVPTAVPTYEPTTVPSQDPTHAPTAEPSVVPTAVPTYEPTTVPSQDPTHAPTAEPSVVPTAVPTYEPTAVPSAEPSAVPSQDPTHAPTAEPSVEPTAVPTYEPTTVPSQDPTHAPRAEPSVVPTAVPTYEPTAVPSAEPSAVPSQDPTHAPTAEPSVEPTAVPTYEPTTVPSDSVPQPTGIPTEMRFRRRLSGLEDNTYQLYVDGMTSSNANELKYTFALEHTPVVEIISPDHVSTAITYNVTLTGDFLSSNPNIIVIVGHQACAHVNASRHFASCVLKRDKDFGGSKSVDVKVYVDNEGYAGKVDNPLALPKIWRGFDLATISPGAGSIMGGNWLSLTGFGFLEGYPERHTVQLIKNGLPALSDYDVLLTSLGFKSVENVYSEDSYLNCTVTFANLTHLLCYLPGHVTVYNSSVYGAKVTLNNIEASCVGANNCTYNQVYEATPVLFGNYSIQEVSALGEYTVTVYGTLLDKGRLESKVYDLPCEILRVTSSFIQIKTSAIPTGVHLVNVSVEGYGYALTETNLTAGSVIHSVGFGSSVGSMGGGTKLNLTGYGFSPVCEENVVTLSVLFADGYIGSVTVKEFVYCSPNYLEGLTPSSLTYNAHGNGSVQSIAFNVQGAPSYFGAFAAVTGGGFQYRTDYTPTVTVNATSGYTYDKLKLTVKFIAPSQVTGIFTRFDSSPCFMNSSFSLVGNTLQQICTVPFIRASATPYKLRVNVEPFGYVVTDKNTLSFPVFTNKLKTFKLPGV
eukprot:gene1800-1926_t